MRRVLVTGASGFLGHHIVKELLQEADIEVIAIGGRPEDKANPLPENVRLFFYSLDRLFSDQFDNIDTVINCAFARSNDAALLAQAFDFTEKLIKRLEEFKVRSVINLSSQGVYKRLPKGELSAENSPIEPVDLYSMAKFATEKLFNISSIPYVTNVRLASLYMPQRFLHFFIQKAINGEHFTVTTPNQYAALLDVTDAATGLACVANMSPEDRASVYNLGIGVQYSLLEYAESVKSIGVGLGYNVQYDVIDNGEVMCSGMNCTKIMHDTGWRPLFLKDELIVKQFNRMAL